MSGVKSGNRLYPSLECGFAKYPLVEVVLKYSTHFANYHITDLFTRASFLSQLRVVVEKGLQGSPPESFVIWVFFGQVTVKQKQFSCLHKELK